MPEDSKKNQQKAKHDPKEQRRPRQRNQPVPVPAKSSVLDSQPEPKTKVPVQTKPVYEEPGPEFYKGLKRETDEILKITEEANSKYKKKEIQSNWAKYEMPIESYEEMEEQENMGADYEKLIEAPLSIGGHFQFKHEKSWDLNTGPSLYDNYFDINMDNLATALSTIPFYERNSLEKSLFSQTDITNMDNRSTRYKQKYFNDKSYTTSELEAQESQNRDEEEKVKHKTEKNISLGNQDVELEKTSNFINLTHGSEVVKNNDNKPEILINILNKLEQKQSLGNKEIQDDLDEILLDAPVDNLDSLLDKVDLETKTEEEYSKQDKKVHLGAKTKEKYPQQQASSAVKHIQDLQELSTRESAKPPVMESPEDLEKWLDDFLES